MSSIKFKKPLLYYHTLKHLKFSQIYYRLAKSFRRPVVHSVSGFLRNAVCTDGWVQQPLGRQTLFDNGRCQFLNRSGFVINPVDWNSSLETKLWLYNLHYFQDLVSEGAGSRRHLQSEWLSAWIAQNPPGIGNGWEPYPLSLRIVNWIKSFMDGLSPEQDWLDSLKIQADYLSQCLEYHLLGNHLFANAKALLFAGCFFGGSAADNWRRVALQILDVQIDEQILNDGGNFELSPMYHALILVDVLDILNLARVYADCFYPGILVKIKKKVPAMLQYLSDMSHPDGKLSFFNDTAWGIAPDNEEIYSYAERLGFKRPQIKSTVLTLSDYQDSGYVIFRSEMVTLIADLGMVGPDYIPGHAHADTLSFELSVGGKRLFVNSGTSEYGVSAERLRQRKTPAHNTVSINGLDSSEVWGGFRVARRARVLERVVSAERFAFSATHDGFWQQGVKCLHAREWLLTNSSLQITDRFDGSFESAICFMHLHPDVMVLEIEKQKVSLFADLVRVVLVVENADIEICHSTWHPEFGVCVQNRCLKLFVRGASVKMQIAWE